MQLAFRIATLAAVLAAATPALAQEKVGRVGIGVGVSSFNLGDLTGTDLMPSTVVFVPLNLAPNLRIEPYLGIDRFDVDPDPVFANGKASTFSIGAGVFYLSRLAPQVQMYLGGRLGFIFESFEDAGPTPDKADRRDLMLAGVLGGEYLPHPRIALGAEVMLGFLAIGETDFTPYGGATQNTGGGSATQTQGTVFVRVYLF